MVRLNLPPYQIRLREHQGRQQIFDFLRRKYVALTPEEWVRQHFIHYLTDHLGYPPQLLANEVELKCGDKRLRCDSILYTTNTSDCQDGELIRPKIIIEYKAPNVQITRKVFDQITAYNILLHVDYLIVSNGLNHYCCKINYEDNTYCFLSEIPRYENI